jgi:PAS domain S-box-containing protein
MDQLALSSASAQATRLLAPEGVSLRPLLEASSELADFFDNAPVPMHLVGADGVILRANRAELAMLGYDAGEYVGQNIRDFHADADVIADILAGLGRGVAIEHRAARLKAKDGSIRHVRITSSANIRDGAFINTRCVTVDVTAEVLADRRASETEHRFRQLLEALPAAIYTTDTEGRITYFNAAAVEMSGRVPELGTDKWCVTWKLYHPDGRPLPHDECPMAVAIRENRPIRNVEALAERPDGTRVPFLPFPSPLRDADGNLIGAVNMLIDISERKESEAHQVTLLKELNHRVKNNMQMLQSLLTAAQRETGDAQARVVLHDATRRVAAMGAAQHVLYTDGRPTSFSAAEFIAGVCATAQAAFNPRPEIEISTCSATLSNDVAMPLALILNELLTNAVKYGHCNGGAIKVAFNECDGLYEMRVEDNGPGFQLAGEIRKRASGLGLVVGLARQIGGTFAVDGSNGARCIVRFPARPLH